jgi:phage terminase large subunit
MMYLTLRCEALSTFDAVFMLDDIKNLSNILACCFFDPVEFEDTKQFLFNHLDTLHKCKSKLTKKFGQWWYEEMSDIEWKAKRENIIVLKSGVHNESDLIDFMIAE